MILSTSAIVLSLLIQDPIQPKALEKLSKEVIETLIMAPSEANNLFNVVTFNVPNTSPSLRVREAVSIQRTVLNSLATLRNERAIQQALSNSLATKEAEDIKRAIELSNLTKIEEDDLRMAIENSLATKEEEDLKQAIELSKLTKIEEDKRRLETNGSLETTNPSAATSVDITNNVAPQLEQSTVSERPIIVPEATLTVPQAVQSEAPAAPTVLPQTAPVAPQPEQNTVTEEPAIVPEATLTVPQTLQNEAPAEPTVLPQTAPAAPQPEENTVTEEPVIVPEATLTAPEAVQNEAPAEPTALPQTAPTAPQPEQNTVTEEPVIVPEVAITAPQTLQNEAPAEPTVLPQTAPVAPQPEQNTVTEEPAFVPEATLTVPQTLQNEAPAEPTVLPQTAPVAPQPEQNTVTEEPVTVPNAIAVTPQLEQNEASTEPTAIPAAPIPPAPPMKILNKPSMPKVEKAKSLQKPSVLQEDGSLNNLFNVLLQSKIAPQIQEDRNALTLTKETLINALKQRQDEIGLSDQNLQLLEAQSLETLKPIIKEFYNEENKEWDFGFADQKSIMSYLTVAPKGAEAQEQTKNVGRLNIKKNNADLLTAIREARGTQKNEEIMTSSAPTITLLDSVKAVTAPTVETDIPQAPAAPKILSSKAQDTLVKLKKNREAAKSDTGMTLLEQILNKDTLIKLQTPAPKTFELKEESSKSLNDFLNSSLSARRKSMEIDDELSDGEDWD